MASTNNLTIIQSLQYLIKAIKNWKFNKQERKEARENLNLSDLATTNVEIIGQNDDNGVTNIQLETNEDPEQNRLKITTGKFVSTVKMSDVAGEKEGNAITGADIDGANIVLKKEKTFVDGVTQPTSNDSSVTTVVTGIRKDGSNITYTQGTALKIGTTANDAAAGNHVHDVATASKNGFMSTNDRTKLDGIEAGAQVNVPDTDATVTLSETIWTDKTIGYITGTATKPVIVANAGDTLKTMFTNIFGTVEDDTKFIVTNPYFSNISIGNASYEYGTSLTSLSVTVTPVNGKYKYGPDVEYNDGLPDQNVAWNGKYILNGTGFVAKSDSSNNTQTVTLSSPFVVGTSKELTLTVSRNYNSATNTAKSKMGVITSQKITAGTATKDATFNPTAVKYVYWAKSTSTDTPTSWTKYRTGQTDIVDLQLSCDAGEYIWVATTENKTSFYAWNDASEKYNTDKLATTKTGTTSIVNAQGASTPGYYIYRTTNPMVQAVNTKFKLA